MKRANLFPHKYKAGDVVGVIADCMADCKIISRLQKRKGKVASYIATAINIHHPKPKDSFFGINKKFIIEERQIVLKIY